MRTPREIAFRILNTDAVSGGYIEDRLDRELRASELEGADRALVGELTRGVTRWRRPLDWLIRERSRGKPPKSKKLECVLRMGFYQLFWLDRIPDHAALNETVALAKRVGVKGLSGFVNGVLRSAQRERGLVEGALERLRESDPALGYSHPEWLFRRWSVRWGEETAIALMRWNNEPAPYYCRVNTSRIGVDELKARCAASGVEAAEATFDWLGSIPFLRLDSRSLTVRTPGMEEGQVYPQDPSSALAPVALAPGDGETILDYCAAPGGKTTAIAQLASSNARIVATDTSAKRLRRVAMNATRLGFRNIELVSDIAEIPARAAAIEGFDRVLVDAPCSNTGVMRRRVDLRWRIQPGEIDRLVAEQASILRECAEFVRLGGTLVYSTCSLEDEENRRLVDAFLESDNRYELVNARALTPWNDGTDGAFVAVLKRV